MNTFVQKCRHLHTHKHIHSYMLTRTHAHSHSHTSTCFGSGSVDLQICLSKTMELIVISAWLASTLMLAELIFFLWQEKKTLEIERQWLRNRSSQNTIGPGHLYFCVYSIGCAHVWLHLDTEALQISLKDRSRWYKVWSHSHASDLTSAVDDIHMPHARPHVVEMLNDCFASPLPHGSSRLALQCGSYYLSMGTDILENLMTRAGSLLRKMHSYIHQIISHNYVVNSNPELLNPNQRSSWRRSNELLFGGVLSQ